MEEALITVLASDKMPPLSEEQIELNKSPKAMEMLTDLSQAAPQLKSFLLHAYRRQKNMRNQLNGTSTLHAEIAEIISNNLQPNTKAELVL
ncbi:Uncharacterised protein [Legionella hackeliae]|nr:hypothetical protein Lhac_0723 [Legionella hackeliae]STX47322.1 Uncharacterised protein [Legionella hackeliae]